VEPEWQGPDSCRAFVREQAAMGFDAVKFLLSNDDVFIPGGSQITQYTQEEASAAGEQARGMAAVYPEIRKRGIRALPGGDYGFPNNPIGRNGRDLDCSPACWAIRRSRR
jgi:hypothetical protein